MTNPTTPNQFRPVARKAMRVNVIGNGFPIETVCLLSNDDGSVIVSDKGIFVLTSDACQLTTIIVGSKAPLKASERVLYIQSPKDNVAIAVDTLKRSTVRFFRDRGARGGVEGFGPASAGLWIPKSVMDPDRVFADVEFDVKESAGRLIRQFCTGQELKGIYRSDTGEETSHVISISHHNCGGTSRRFYGRDQSHNHQNSFAYRNRNTA